MPPACTELSPAEHHWVAEQLQAASAFVAVHSPPDSGSAITLGALDRAFSSWLGKGVSDPAQVNAAVNAVGIAFGSLLVRDAGFSWVIATDGQGTDLAVRALPDTADVLLYPANFVAKRWERREGTFMQAAFAETARQVREIAASMPPTGAKRSLWQRLKGGG